MSAVRLITFDVTNTILKVIGSPSIQYSAAAKRCGVDVSVGDLEMIYPREFKLHKQKFPHYGITQGLTSRDWWTIFVKNVFAKAGYKGTDETLNSVVCTLYDNFKAGKNWEVLPNSNEILHQLRNEGFRLAVISNFDERLSNTLEVHGLREYFEFLVTSAEAKADKPSPLIYQYALTKAKLSAEQCLHVGDDLQNDFLGARSVGMHSILVDRLGKYKNHPGTADIDKRLIVDSLLNVNTTIKTYL